MFKLINLNIMKNNLIAQEILIAYKSTPFNKQFEKKNRDDSSNFTPKEMIADACWNGILFEIVPEITTHLSLRDINETESFLALNYGAFDYSFDNELSLNPYLFLQSISEN